MTTTILFQIALWLMPALAMAQANELQGEFMAASHRYAAEDTITLTQRYLFALDSAGAVPFDSGYCVIEKRGRMMHCMFNGVESFSDGTYQVRISNPGRYMLVARRHGPDSSAPGIFFSEGLAGFKSILRETAAPPLARWKLSGGTYGVPEAEITFDTHDSSIRSVLAELAPEHPFLSGINAGKPGPPHAAFIRIDYSYQGEPSSAPQQLSDYVIVRDGAIVPAEKYSGYRVQVIE